MGKDDTTGKDATEGKDATKRDKKSGGDEKKGSGADSSSELEPTHSKKGEPDDNLRRRSEWFQKRHGGS
ncbi:MAG TPA: hypothetical protein VGO73_13135 [Pyrinomonadaceae bacterium]|jgi:hypothetical protein|nr:hypothetical protein [Pyrinomonadaceae bacterium]